MKRLLRWWHLRKATQAGALLKILEVKVAEYMRAEKNYGSSYYTDLLHEALFHRAYQEFLFDYHKVKVDALNQ